ncbi:alpha-L-arabinofuranosidase C-terminal domain-containing protein [Virgisporangium ochraceum]|uniref:non-reducing end alpha-L-arabinofuranosidase n=1 Tax=Virgisporangium ochraceum TaxID=65505 RepID=A0A8J3ZRS5_9ACTN|nr:alpha-L-arabinofuranosidase C-terminal domain-containing protein [Virgisporangium ochraceum]GIJ66788.1 alpha-N-arabinofuranosidase [Virgisporangium ochraceum]
MPRARTLVGLAIVALVGSVGAVPAQARAPEPTPDYTITVDPRAAGADISDSMYGVFFEDINFAADGGLYAELVRNRSFEFLPIDNQSYTGLTAWTPNGVDGGAGTATTVDDAARLHERNRTYLNLALSNPDGGWYGVTNAGWNTGVAVQAGDRYDFSVWARTDAAAGTPLSVTVHDAQGDPLATPLTRVVRGDTWSRYTGTLTARRDSDVGRLSVRAAGTGTLRLDMVSLFPQKTFKGRANGLRKDLAEKIAALKPGFVRFPGGCLVNTNSMYGYDASSNWERSRSYQWKDTVGPVEQRATNRNFWGYNQSYGLGYFEYFQFSEDVGAMPLPVVPALVTGCGQNRATADEALLQRHIQDTLDLIEFANGPASSTWGGLRARMGHPKPYALTHIAIGNEENLPNEFFANFLRFRSAIKARYPDITVISNSGPDDTGATFDRLWTLNREAGVDMVDEHYYNTPGWFLQNNHRYDSYDRNGPKVFLGEFASQDNKFFNSLAEAHYMTGLERNADVVRLAAYAPLLANIDHVQWRPDLIWFDSDESWGTTSYQVQKLFMNNVGDRTVPSRFTAPVVPPRGITGAVGLSTWATAARYDDVKVTGTDGGVLFSDDFANGAGQWSAVEPRGAWSVVDGQYQQSDTAALDTLVRAGNITATDYDLTLKATKLDGAEGFLVAFGVQESGELYWWNLGGWNNTQGAIQKGAGGSKSIVIAKPNTIQAGVAYDIRVEVRGTTVRLFLNNEEWGSFVDDQVTQPFAQVVTRDDRTGELIVKVVNAQDAPATTRIDLGRQRVRDTARTTVITGDPGEQNTRSAEPIQPVTGTVRVGSRFTHTFPPNSVTFLRIRTR